MALPGLGPEVGDAYIEVHADTTKFRAQLRKRLAKEMVDFSKQAQRTFEDYLNLDKAADWETFHRNLAQATRSGDFGRLQRQFKDTGDWVGEVTKRIEDLKDVWVEVEDAEGGVSRRKLFKVDEIKAATKAMENYVKELEQTDREEQVKKNTLAWIDYEREFYKTHRSMVQLAREIEDVNVKDQEDQIRKAAEAWARYEKQTSAFYLSLAAKYERDAKAFEAAERQKQETRDRMTRLHATALREQSRMEEEAAAEALARRRRIVGEMVFETRAGQAKLQDLAKWTADVRRELAQAEYDQRESLGARQEDWDRYINYMRASYITLRQAEKKARDLEDREAEEAETKRKRRYSVFFDPMRKSRSEFIHGMAVLLDWISTGVGRAGDAVAKFFSYFEGGGGGFRQMFSDIADFAMKVGGNWQAILITIGAIIASLSSVAALTGILISLGSGLLGIVTALVSSLGMALVSLVPLVGVLAGMGYGIGLLAASFKDMDRYLPGVSGALEELKRVFTDVDVPAFAAGVAGPLKDLFTSLSSSLESDEVAGALGRAFGGIITALDGVINSRGWKSFMRALETTIPAAIEGFGTGFAGVLEGLFSAFEAGGPAVEKMGAAFQTFGENFASTMEEMDKTGRLDEIFDLAADSMIAVSDLAWALGEALVGLFTAAAPAGNDMLESITGLVRKFTEWVTSAEGQNKIAEWMEHAKDVADKVWDILKEVGGQLERLDTPANRRWAISLLNLIRGIVVGIGNIIFTAGKMWETWETGYQAVSGFVQDVGKAFGDFGAKVGEVWQSIMDGWNDFMDGWNEFWGGVSWGTLGSDIMQPFEDMWNGFVEGWSGFLDSWNEFWDGVDWGTLGSDIWQGFIDGITSAWSGFVDQVSDMFLPFINTVKEALGISSPSTVFAEIGRDVIAGFRQGIEEAWTTFTTWVTGLFTGLVDTAKTAWDTLRTDVTTKWDAIVTAVREKAEEISADLSAKWESIRTNVSDKVEAIRSAVSTKWDEIRANVSAKVESIRTDLSSKWESIRSNVSTKWDQIKSAISTKWEQIKSGTSAKIAEVAALVGGLPKKAVDALPRIGTTLYQAGKDLIEGFLSGMRVKIQSVIDTAAGMAQSVVTTVSKRLGMKSPSKVFERLGMLTAQGYEIGLEKRQAAVQHALSRLVAPPNLNVPGTKSNLASARAYTTSRTLNIAPGAIMINTRATDPRIAANMILDSMASRMMGV